MLEYWSDIGTYCVSVEGHKISNSIHLHLYNPNFGWWVAASRNQHAPGSVSGPGTGSGGGFNKMIRHRLMKYDSSNTVQSWGFPLIIFQDRTSICIHSFDTITSAINCGAVLNSLRTGGHCLQAAWVINKGTHLLIGWKFRWLKLQICAVMKLWDWPAYCNRLRPVHKYSLYICVVYGAGRVFPATIFISQMYCNFFIRKGW